MVPYLRHTSIELHNPPGGRPRQVHRLWNPGKLADQASFPCRSRHPQSHRLGVPCTHGDFRSCRETKCPAQSSHAVLPSLSLSLGISHIKDTQCGFKLFTRAAAASIFPSLHVEGWIFDIEILIIAGLLGDVRVREVPIRWGEVHGSKMDLVKDSLRMATDLLVIRGIIYAIGRWRVKR